jgi:hypothetical protein
MKLLGKSLTSSRNVTVNTNNVSAVLLSWKLVECNKLIFCFHDIQVPGAKDCDVTTAVVLYGDKYYNSSTVKR